MDLLDRNERLFYKVRKHSSKGIVPLKKYYDLTLIKRDSVAKNMNYDSVA